MMQRQRESAVDRRRGVTILEVVVALFLLTLTGYVTASALQSAEKVQSGYRARCDAELMAENTIAAFRYADSVDAFAESLTACDGIIINREIYNQTEENDEARFLLSGAGYALTVTVIYPSTEDGRPTLSGEAENEDGEMLFAFDYRKG